MKRNSIMGYECRLPEPVVPGMGITIVTPATVVREAYVANAVEKLEARGYRVKVGRNVVFGENGIIAGSAESRAADINEALADTATNAIWCARGGYGSVELLPLIDAGMVAASRKWLIGFSDVCALHSLWLASGVAALHAPMLRTFGQYGEPESTIAATSGMVKYGFAANALNVTGEGRGVLMGGNVAVLGDLGGTPYDMVGQYDRAVLLLEDVGESISRLERRLWRLYLAGVIGRCSAIIVGRFSAYEPNGVYCDMEHMISDCFERWNVRVPVAYGVPVGHGGENRPLILGRDVVVRVDYAGVSIEQG